MSSTPQAQNAITKATPQSPASRSALQTRQSFCLPITSSASENSGAEHGDRQYSMRMRPSFASNAHQGAPSHCNSGWTIQAHLGYRGQCCEENAAASERISQPADMGEDDHDSDDQHADRRQGGSRPRKPHLQVHTHFGSTCMLPAASRTATADTHRGCDPTNINQAAYACLPAALQTTT